MEHKVEKILYSKQGAAEALSLCVRSIDYLITTQRLPMRRVGGKVMIPAAAVRRFAREDHPERVRGDGHIVSFYSEKRRGSEDSSRTLWPGQRRTRRHAAAQSRQVFLSQAAGHTPLSDSANWDLLFRRDRPIFSVPQSNRCIATITSFQSVQCGDSVPRQFRTTLVQREPLKDIPLLRAGRCP